MGRQGAAARKAAKDARRGRGPVRRPSVGRSPSRIRFGRRSLLLFAAGGVSIAVGYVFLGVGSITVAPILLVAGYCVFFPTGILMSGGASGRRGGE